MSKNFVTSDWHIGHANIIKYCPESRGHFSSIEEMNETIITNMNSVVSDGDVLYILGDIAFAKPSVAVDTLKRVNGAKVIIWGNHDRKLRDSSEFLNSRGIMGVVGEYDYLCKSFVDTKNGVKQSVCLQHFPLLAWDRMHHGAYMFHGHWHSPRGSRLTMPGKRIMDIGVDGNHMFPYDLDELMGEMSVYEYNYVGHHDGTRQ